MGAAGCGDLPLWDRFSAKRQCLRPDKPGQCPALAQISRANDPSRRYVINFSRGPLFGTGGGHHSPIAGYLDEDDLVLILDVNKKYGPWLIKSQRLYEAMNTVDTTAQKRRGLLLIE
jgi:hypothetical protein